MIRVRLVGGRHNKEGRVEILYNNVWGTVCDDTWGNEEAQLVCRELGLPWGGAIAVGGAHFGEGSGRIWLVDCTGLESTMQNCAFDIRANAVCGHNEDAGVRCVNGKMYYIASIIRSERRKSVEKHIISIFRSRNFDVRRRFDVK